MQSSWCTRANIQLLPWTASSLADWKARWEASRTHTAQHQYISSLYFFSSPLFFPLFPASHSPTPVSIPDESSFKYCAVFPLRKTEHVVRRLFWEGRSKEKRKEKKRKKKRRSTVVLTFFIHHHFLSRWLQVPMPPFNRTVGRKGGGECGCRWQRLTAASALCVNMLDVCNKRFYFIFFCHQIV